MRTNFLFKTLAVLCLNLTFCFFCFAQNDAPGFGEYTPAEIKMKECSFDRNADAVVLLDQGIAYFNEEYNLITDRRIRLKILKEKGIDRADIRIPYYSSNKFEFIRELSAVVLTPDDNGNVTQTELERKNVFDKQVNSLYSMVSFALPNVKVGSIIDYKYQSVMKNYAGLRRWEFQKEIPVVTSSYELAPIPNSEFAYSVYRTQNFPVDIKPDKAAGRVRFSMHNIPGLRDEVYSPSTTNFLQRVNFQFASYTNYFGKTNYTSTWQQLATELLDDRDFGSQANKDLSATPFLKALSPSLSQIEKLKSIYDFVRSNIVWNHIGSKYAEEGVKSTLEKKKGNSGDINLLLIALLKSAGLDAYPLLASGRDNGLIDTSYSYLGQFDKVVALVVCNGKDYVLDGTDMNTPFWLVPSDLLNTTGFLVDKKKRRFVYLTHLPEAQKEVIGIQATIQANGTIEGTATVTNADYSKLEKKSHYQTDEAKYRDALLKPYSFLKIDTFSVDGLKDDSAALKQSLTFHYDLKKSGGYYLLNTNLFTGLTENPFITQYRFTNIDFASRYNGTIYGSYFLPESLTIESLPANKKLVSPDRSMSVSRLFEKKDNQIQSRFTIEINRELYDAEEYESVKAFFKEMIDLLNEPLLLKSK